LTPAERDEISAFVFLWSYVESLAFEGNAEPPTIKRNVERWEQDGAIQVGAFAEGLAYFRNRYVENGQFTRRYDFLRVHRRENRSVEPVLKGKADGDGEVVTALLYIVHRLRNNLFHGNKWEYELQGQLDNFRHANLILMRAVDCHDRAR
jgi:hypothetical protein